MIYGRNIVELIIKIYGKDSEMYKQAFKGENIRELIKADISKKGKGCSVKIAVKKKLYKLVKEKEDELSKTSCANVNA